MGLGTLGRQAPESSPFCQHACQGASHGLEHDVAAGLFMACLIATSLLVHLPCAVEEEAYAPPQAQA